MANDEANLIARAQRGNLDAFNTLVLRYQDSVFSLAYRIMGESASAADSTQDALVNAFRRLDTYRGGSFKSWLLRIAANVCYDELRSRKRKPATSIEDMLDEDSADAPELRDPSASPEQIAQQRELQRAIQQCIEGLGDEQRIVIVLSDVNELSYQEIAEATKVQIGTVKSRLSRARAGVRDCLQGVRELLPPDFRL
jgi:RNA polymerase sigma-70 factor, ECF subfamily